jgi:hypothetical protein
MVLYEKVLSHAVDPRLLSGSVRRLTLNLFKSLCSLLKTLRSIGLVSLIA